MRFARVSDTAADHLVGYSPGHPLEYEGILSFGSTAARVTSSIARRAPHNRPNTSYAVTVRDVTLIG
jgi:hypothetical protein